MKHDAMQKEAKMPEESISPAREADRENSGLTAEVKLVCAAPADICPLDAHFRATCPDLQSLNGRLSAITSQLQSRIAELETINADLFSLLSDRDTTTICLDRDCNIKWVVPAMHNLCNLGDKDIGCSIAGISQAFTGTALIEDAQVVLEQHRQVLREMELDNGRFYLRRIVPYRAVDHHPEGVLVSYTDITENKRLAERAAEAQRSMYVMLEKMVHERTLQLSALTSELAMTEERERRKLAQDLHDDLSQVLSIIKIKLNLIDHQERRGNLKEVLRDMHALTDQASRSVRSLASRLSPPVLHTLGLVPALDWLTEEMERLYGLTVYLHDDGAPKPIAEPARTVVFRAVGELLANVAKHAGAPWAEVACCLLGEGRLVVTVSDQGAGFDYDKVLSAQAGATGLGLLGVRERLASIGGDVDVDSTPGEGTTITLFVPLAVTMQTGEGA